MPLPTRKPTEAERKILEKEMARARKERDRAVNNSKTRTSTTHRPTPKRTRRDIMNELT